MFDRAIVQRAGGRRGSPAIRLAPAPGSADGCSRRIGRIVCAVDRSEAAEALARELRSRLVGVSLAGRRMTRGTAERLLELVSAERAELLFVPRPRSGLFEAALTRRRLRELVRRAPCPVVVLPTPPEPDPRPRGAAGSIVCGVDASAGARLAASVAGQLAARLDVRVIAVRAFEGNPGDEEMMRAWRLLSRTVDDLGDTAEGRVVFGSPGLMLNAVSAREQSRLIVVGSRGAGPLRSTLSRSVSMQLASTATRPVVIAPPLVARERLGITTLGPGS